MELEWSIPTFVELYDWVKYGYHKRSSIGRLQTQDADADADANAVRLVQLSGGR